MIDLFGRLEQVYALQEIGEGTINSVVADFERPMDLNEAMAIIRGCWAEGIWLARPSP